jgi:hypothetical protein
MQIGSRQIFKRRVSPMFSLHVSRSVYRRKVTDCVPFDGSVQKIAPLAKVLPTVVPSNEVNNAQRCHAWHSSDISRMVCASIGRP